MRWVYEKEIADVLAEIELLEFEFSGVVVRQNESLNARILDCLNAYLFYLRGLKMQEKEFSRCD